LLVTECREGLPRATHFNHPTGVATGYQSRRPFSLRPSTVLESGWLSQFRPLVPPSRRVTMNLLEISRQFITLRFMATSDMSDVLLKITGEVERPLALSFANLAALDAAMQVTDVSRLDPKRAGDAVTLAGLLKNAGAKPSAQWLTLHSATDDFHASIPLNAVRDTAILIYRLNGESLPVKSGGPFRFFIPNFAACHSAEVDECANVKFVDHIELSSQRGHDNRPLEDREHAELHRRQEEEARRAAAGQLPH
jgi:hypothetical protein